MKASSGIVLGVLGVVACLLAAWFATPRQGDESHGDSLALVPPTSVLTESEEVFKKAFWRRPTAADHILHAERREWADANGVRKWQWFIEVEPSPELVKYLREDNAFGLSPGAAAPVGRGAPDWYAFDSSDADLLRSRQGSLQLSFVRSKKLLFATDAGGGFNPGAPEPTKAAAPAQTASAGRLPVTPPPNPNTP